MKTDQELESDVREALLWDPTLTSDRITVRAVGGIVTLSGRVTFYAEKRAAERAVHRVAGVTALADELDVQHLKSRDDSDAELAAALASALHWHVWVPGSVAVTVDQGWVTLSGTTRWEFERSAAERAVRYMSGVLGVTNAITLVPLVATSQVHAAIETSLRRNARVDADRIKVSASGGKVTLSGTARTWEERTEASWAAWSAPGVTGVDNDLQVVHEK
jgi:osmotically-inducible protein OsmY